MFGLTVLMWLAARTYSGGPPIPERVVDSTGAVIFTGTDIMAGQQVFLKYGLMENGTIWGHGAYLGPDFSAAYLHAVVEDAREHIAAQQGRPWPTLAPAGQAAVDASVRVLLKHNGYDDRTRTLTLSDVEAASYPRQIAQWQNYFAQPHESSGLPPHYITDPDALRQLTAFFAWTAWASVAVRPGTTYSYTNNFPYDPVAGNTVTSEAILWSALSLITLLAGTGLALLAFGKFDYLGWKGRTGHVHPQLLPGVTTPSQRATLKYFVLVAVLFLAQVLVGGATAHYRADPSSFYGVDLSRLLPSNRYG